MIAQAIGLCLVAGGSVSTLILLLLLRKHGIEKQECACAIALVVGCVLWALAGIWVAT